MCNMRQEAMERAGETGETHSAHYYDTDRNEPVAGRAPTATCDAAAVMAVTQLMVDLARTIDAGSDQVLMIQAAAVLEALGRLPVVDAAVQADLLKVAHGEIAHLTAEVTHLAGKLAERDAGAVARSVRDDSKFLRLLKAWGDCAPGANAMKLGDDLADYIDALIDSRATPATPSAVPVAGSEQTELVRELRNIAAEDATPYFCVNVPKGLLRRAADALDSRATPAVPSVDRNSVRDAVADNLRDLYHCGRVWSAWGYGTMSEGDFSPAEEDEDIISNITDAVIAAIGSAAAPQPVAAAQAVPEGSLHSLTTEQVKTLHRVITGLRDGWMSRLETVVPLEMLNAALASPSPAAQGAVPDTRPGLQMAADIADGIAEREDDPAESMGAWRVAEAIKAEIAAVQPTDTTKGA